MMKTEHFQNNTGRRGHGASRKYPTYAEIDDCLRGYIDVELRSHKEADGKVRDPDALKRIDLLNAARAVVISQMERTCVLCGCTDSKACKGGCAWAIEHKHTPTGICTRCVPKFVKSADAL